MEDTTILHVEGKGVTCGDLKFDEPEEDDHDYAAIPAVEQVSEYKEAVINYICGFVVRNGVEVTLSPQSDDCSLSLFED